MSAATSPSWCHADEFGLVDLRCLWALLDAEERAYTRGYAAGWEQRTATIDTEAAQVVEAAARSIDVRAARAKPYVTPGWATPRPGVRP